MAPLSANKHAAAYSGGDGGVVHQHDGISRSHGTDLLAWQVVAIAVLVRFAGTVLFVGITSALAVGSHRKPPCSPVLKRARERLGHTAEPRCVCHCLY